MYYLEDYTETHKSALNTALNSAKSSRVFSAVRQEDMLLFFREWMKHDGEYIAYDVTSISSYSKNISELEWDYNRDKERLPRLSGKHIG